MPRITLDVDNTFNENLNSLVNSTSATSKAEVIRNAVAVYGYLKSSVPKSSISGAQVIEVSDSNGTKTNMLIP
jgi:hypothetical protein